MKYRRFWIWSLGLSLFLSLPTFCTAEEAEESDIEECEIFIEALNFYQGNGVEQDIPRAVTLFERAAVEEQHVDSMKMLIRIYSLGEGVEVDKSKILKFLQMAAEAGDADCQCALGQVLIRVKKKECVPWFERAAEQNHPEAQRTLGIFRSTGRYLPKDDEKAVEWFQKAADQNDPIAQLLLGQALRDGIGVAKDEAKAFSYFLKSAKAGNAEALFNTAVCYINGIGAERDTEKAKQYLRLSAQQDFAPAIQLMKKTGLRLPE